MAADWQRCRFAPGGPGARGPGPGGEVIEICSVVVQNMAYIGAECDGDYGPVKSHLADNYYHRGQKGSIMNKICEYDQILF